MLTGKTIAVLGNGPKYIFPPINREIYRKILDSGGAIVSEYPEDMEPESYMFRQRNRIVSGISLGIVIVEAEYRSGTSITAKYAREQGRDVFCLPNSRDNRKGIGTNMQIQKGAKLVMEPKEIIEKYAGNIIEQISIYDLDRKNEVDISEVKDEYRDIYKALKNKLNINELSIKTKTKIEDLYQTLFMMEMEGLIEKSENKYKRKA